MTTLPLTVCLVNPNPSRYGVRSPKGGCTVAGRFFRGGQFCLPFDPANPHGLKVDPPAPAVEPAPTKLAIYGFTYTAREIPAGECGSVAFELHKIETNNHYHVIRDDHGLVKCDCPSYVLTHEGTAGLCKHGARLVELGLVPAPTPIPSNRVGRESVIPDRVEFLAPRRRRFEPSSEEMAEAAQLFGDLAVDRMAYHRELAAAL